MTKLNAADRKELSERILTKLTLIIMSSPERTISQILYDMHARGGRISPGENDGAIDRALNDMLRSVNDRIKD